LTVSGNLTVSGTTTTINTANLTIDDPNIELNAIASPTNANADGGGITLKGATDKTLSWDLATLAWKSSENINIAGGVGTSYKIAGTNVLTATTLGSGVTASSLTSVGTLSGLGVTGTMSFQGGATFQEITNSSVPVQILGSLAFASTPKDLLQWKDFTGATTYGKIDGTGVVQADTGLTVKSIEIDPAGSISGQVLTFSGGKYIPQSPAGGSLRDIQLAFYMEAI
jgi:hypothetical protein